MTKTIIYLMISFAVISLKSQTVIPSYIPTNGLLAWWPFNGNANDESNHTNHGTVNGATLTSDRFNALNSAYSFDGNDYITVPDNSTGLRPVSYAISAWMSFNTVNSTRMILAKNVGTGSLESIGLYCESSVFKSIICTTSTFGQIVTTTTTPNPNQWYHMIDQFDDINNVHQIYINGVLVKTTTENLSLGYDVKPWTIGMEYENGILAYYFNGKIDDIAIWDRILTPAEIAEVYQANSAGIEDNELLKQVFVYPNPTKNVFLIDIAGNDKGLKYLITDVSGQKILNGDLNASVNKVGIEQLPVGIYFIEIMNNNQKKVFKIIKTD